MTDKLSRDIEQTVFDVAVGSMDFGSGFLDNSEVEALRAYAEYLGVDPREATPMNFRAQYYCQDGHDWNEYSTSYVATIKCWRTCKDCGKFDEIKA